ncbi:MAG: bifunctional diaminohydroxyphosphoribosylaminopyrimidine deaminase/5-amino-6-(5-phosphoribosylamino)uracil reductase RibD [Proteobacteria bacterium]|nr:bifunctional diaminohydroxyphosphoribosylaminopyrimidine deaminase/5-amino-6-(5-phosphoribosylamino)uracil reductase RibD [Pseudomonadota bacterium]
MDDSYFMAIALALAENGCGFTSPNPMVGCVVVKDGLVVGKGWHEKAGQPHAEVNAINDAGENANEATLYVTLEPCNHTGRTPPCTEKILSAGIKRVVIAMEDPNPDVKGGGIARLKEAGLSISSGILKDKALKLNESFVKYVLTKKPFVTLKCAATLDGQIATRSGDSKWVTGPESRNHVHELRHMADAILVGIQTVITDNPSLTTRREGLKGKNPARIILDSRLSIPEDAKVLQPDTESGTIIFSGILAEIDASLLEKKAQLEKNGARVIETPLNNDLIDFNIVLDRLGGLGITSLLIEGGGRVISSALSAGIVDKIVMFYAPKFLGGNDGVPVCRGIGPEKMDDCIQMENITLKRFGDDVMIEGYVKKR